MRVDAFDYVLPEELIAQEPAARRDESRLMIVRCCAGELFHRRFHELPRFLRAGDCLVVNDSRVRPARLVGRKAHGGGRIELLLLRRVRGDDGDDVQDWDVLLRPGRRVRERTRLELPGGIVGEVLARTPEGGRRVRFSGPRLSEQLRRQGELPLPPYIRRRPADPERYQTVYARAEGSVAAPTAGLHFTPELLETLRAGGVRIASLTLHVGIGTFRPVRVEHVEDHEMHGEWFEIPEATAQAIDETRRRGGRVVAVGTTVTRALETMARADGGVRAGAGETRLFITPGFRFRVVDALLTNLHLPRSTLMMLVAAFCGRRRILAAYREAVRCRYRFFSFGDAMLLLRGERDAAAL